MIAEPRPTAQEAPETPDYSPGHSEGALGTRARDAYAAKQDADLLAHTQRAEQRELDFYLAAGQALEKLLGVADPSPALWEGYADDGDTQRAEATVDLVRLRFARDSEWAGLSVVIACETCGRPASVSALTGIYSRDGRAIVELGGILTRADQRDSHLVRCDEHKPTRRATATPFADRPMPPSLPERLAALLSDLHDAWHVGDE